MTEGRRLLRAALGRAGGVRALARRLGESQRFRVSHAAISFWASGARTPEYAGRAALHRELSIDLDAWERDALFTPVTTAPVTVGAEVHRT